MASDFAVLRTFGVLALSLSLSLSPPPPLSNSLSYPLSLTHTRTTASKLMEGGEHGAGASIKPAGLDLTWLLADFEKALAKELDFETEAANLEQVGPHNPHPTPQTPNLEVGRWGPPALGCAPHTPNPKPQTPNPGSQTPKP